MRRLLAAVLIVVAVACGAEQGPSAGRVTDKRYDDPDEWYQSGFSTPERCSGGYGSVPRTCTPGVYIPGHWEHDGPHWHLKLRSDGGKKEGWRQVDETTYHRCQRGSWCDTAA